MIAIVALAITSSLWVLLDLAGAYSRNSEAFGVTAFENRFTEFRKTLAPHSKLAYLSDNPASDPSAIAEFYLTQYTLVPAIVRASTDEPLVVANLHSDSSQSGLQAKQLVVVRNFGNGVLLCRRVAQ